ncbi:MAG: hypothetical protein AAFQ80_23260 [Cyanobacteria bacterium J06621_8]
MAQLTFDTPVLKVKGLETKFDVIPVSNSLAILIGDRDLATIVQQLYHWTNQGYGEVIEGVRWFYKSIKEWIVEVFPTFSPWKLGKMMKQLSERGIIRRKKLFTQHQIQKGDRFWWQPQNQTYYYSLNYDKLQELAANFSVSPNPQTPENFVSIKTQTLSIEEIKLTKDFDCPKNTTNITSTKNNSKEKSHPTLPCESNNSKLINQDLQITDNLKSPKTNFIDFANPILPNKEIKVPQLEQLVNQDNCTSKTIVQNSVQVGSPEPEFVEELEFSKVEQAHETASDRSVAKPKSKLKTPKGTKSVPKRIKSAPWKDEGQFKRFYRALIQALPIVANARSPQGLAQVIIRQLRSGIPHTYWDDFVAGLPIGTSTKPEWEVEPGVPYPMFIEFLTEKIIKGNNTQTPEQARNEVFRILSYPRQATAFWGQFKRSVVNVSQQVERNRALGVRNPNTPVWTRERIEPSIEEAITAGNKIAAANGDVRAAIDAARTNPQLRGTSVNDNDGELLVSDPWIDSDSNNDNNTNPQLTLREMAAKRKIQGLCQPMPSVSESFVKAETRRERSPKTNINQMSMAEINDYLTDPVLRAELTPQLMGSNYELITDEMGRIIGVKAPPPAQE